jgi:hypothetical protein
MSDKLITVRFLIEQLEKLHPDNLVYIHHPETYELFPVLVGADIAKPESVEEYLSDNPDKVVIS